MTWHMQHEDRLKMITGCSEMRRWIRVSVDSSTSMDREGEEEELVMEEEEEVVVRSRWTMSLEQRRRPCIALLQRSSQRKREREYRCQRVREGGQRRK